jgi:hypothetical protein
VFERLERQLHADTAVAADNDVIVELIDLGLHALRIE